jgi:hypothetical protein
MNNLIKIRKNSCPTRIDSDFAKELKKIAEIRVKKGLANLKKEEISAVEMTRLLRRTNGWRISLEELMTKPKRRENETNLF